MNLIIEWVAYEELRALEPKEFERYKRSLQTPKERGAKVASQLKMVFPRGA